MAVARIYYLSLVWLHKKQTITENAYDRKARIVRVNALFSSINLLFTFIKQQLQLWIELYIMSTKESLTTTFHVII